MKILTLLGLLVLLNTSPMTNCFTGQFQPLPIPVSVPVPVAGYHSSLGSNIGFLALAIIAFSNLLGSSPTEPPSPRCPSGYTWFSNDCSRFCVRFEATKCTTWDNARFACVEENADLWMPDACTYQFFQGLAQQNEGPCNDFWIGAFRARPTRNYMTVRGNPIQTSFPFWAGRQPDRGNASCVQMEDRAEYLMDDELCNIRSGYICQKFLSSYVL